MFFFFGHRPPTSAPFPLDVTPEQILLYLQISSRRKLTSTAMLMRTGLGGLSGRLVKVMSPRKGRDRLPLEFGLNCPGNRQAPLRGGVTCWVSTKRWEPVTHLTLSQVPAQSLCTYACAWIWEASQAFSLGNDRELFSFFCMHWMKSAESISRLAHTLIMTLLLTARPHF